MIIILRVKFVALETAALEVGGDDSRRRMYASILLFNLLFYSRDTEILPYYYF